MLKILTLVVGYVRTNCYIAYDDQTFECAVIDPGDDSEGILALLETHKLTARYIFLTHGHFDHILAVPALQEATGAEVVIHESDAACLADPVKSLAPTALHKSMGDVPVTAASDGADFSMRNLHFQWLHTPGHTLGSSCIICEGVIFTGDTLFASECGRCDLPGGDYRVMLRSLRRLSGLPENYTVLPGHGDATTLETERCQNPYMREAVSTASPPLDA